MRSLLFAVAAAVVMSERVQLEPYAAAHYNALPMFPDVFKNSSRTDVINKLGKVIQFHGLSDYVGVALLHRHFALHDGEVLVERVTDESGVPGTHTTPVSPMPAGGIVPYLFDVTDSDSLALRPLEFMNATEFHGTEESWRVLLTHPRFIHDWRDAAKELDVAGLFGFTLLHRTLVAEHSPVHGTSEASSESERWLHVTPATKRVTSAPGLKAGPASEPAAPSADVLNAQVVWSFPETAAANAMPVEGQWCFAHHWCVYHT